MTDIIALRNSSDLVEGGWPSPSTWFMAEKPAGPSRSASKASRTPISNRCSHVAMEMDYQPDRFFDDTGQWLLCATHGAAYKPGHRRLRGRPCRGGLVKIELSERDGVVHWHTDWNLQPIAF